MQNPPSFQRVHIVIADLVRNPEGYGVVMRGIVILDLIQNPQDGAMSVIADLIRNPEGRYWAAVILDLIQNP